MICEKLAVSKVKAPYRPACHPLVCASGKQRSLLFNVIIIIFRKDTVCMTRQQDAGKHAQKWFHTTPLFDAFV
ncbi:hypothetical protein D5086_018116 [Populus alba]|uniref:Uncharacterized protein n=1 Tax=Populus alba TaxID=43335 RepID=A0ACC4BQF7_POPAL